MDALISAAGRALAVGDPLGALQRVSLREDPPALALRGIAMAQLGELALARELLRRAARGFGSHEALARARCVVAEAEVALATRDLRGAPRTLAAAAAALKARGDHANAHQARLIGLRRLLLLGRLDEAAAALDGFDVGALGPPLRAVAELAAAELALRSLRTAAARAALGRAQGAAADARVPSLIAEVAEAQAALDRPAARRDDAGATRPLRLDEVEALLTSGALVVDACRRGLRAGAHWQPLATRPVLFALLRALAEAWPGDVDRHALIERAFRTRGPDETHRARLRVEIGRLRRLVAPLARVEASARGFALVSGADDGRTRTRTRTRHGDGDAAQAHPQAPSRPSLQAAESDPPGVVVLLPPVDGEQAAMLALLADGAAWSTSALALALGASQRTVQRSLVELEAAGRARSVGRGRAQRWLAPPWAGFTTILLLPAALPRA